MCVHSWVKVNDVKYCPKCGFTVTYDGKIIFDRKIKDYRDKKRGK